jgi:hypothetical protein
MVGSAILRALKKRGELNIVTRTHAELDLTNQAAVQQFFAQEKPTQVYLAAAKVGGIHANNTHLAGQCCRCSIYKQCAKNAVLGSELNLPCHFSATHS